jgi:predicted transcriptional regulator
MKTEALMSKSLAACSPGDSLGTAAQIMWDRDIGFLPVVEPDGRVVGTITDRDIAMGGFINGRALNEISVGQVMSTRVVT